MFDSFNRPITYLRVSITDLCNLRCVYCMPETGIQKLERADILSFEEITKLVQIGAGLGINKIRLTGGEPLVRRGVMGLIRSLTAIPGITECALTTNGILLEQFAGELAAAGLPRVNISLDSLNPEKFRQITRGGELSSVLAGIQAAKKHNLIPIKVNAVIIRGLNDDEISDFVRLAKTADLQVRFIEVMPFSDNAHYWSRDKIVPVSEIFEAARQSEELIPAEPVGGAGPARIYRFKSGQGSLGFISPVSSGFCHQCNRLRLTADGRLMNCLYTGQEFDLKTPLRSGASDQALADLFVYAAKQKHKGHHIQSDCSPVKHGRGMSKIGG